MEVFRNTRPELKALSHQIFIMPEPKKIPFHVNFLSFYTVLFRLR